MRACAARICFNLGNLTTNRVDKVKVGSSWKPVTAYGMNCMRRSYKRTNTMPHYSASISRGEERPRTDKSVLAETMRTYLARLDMDIEAEKETWLKNQ